MKKIYKLLMTAALLMITAAVMSQGTTTAGINGRVLDTNGEPLTGATVLVVEQETGAQYGTVTDDKGYYRLPNMNPGGPYKMTITFVGFQSYDVENFYLTLGQTLKVDATLSETAMELGGVEIVGNINDVFDGNRTGAETYVPTEVINQMPTLGRTIGDYVRITPQATFSQGGISIAGANNRYNAISIDGAVNNDVFGLAASGTNGGQTGGTPWSMDIIDQFQIQLAPYDVRQSGFNGASINAVTKRGKNHFEGTAYWFMQNQGLAGKTPWASVEDLQDPEGAREKLADFNDNIYGLSIGGPIVKDKLFFFLNGEFQRKKTPQPYEISNYQGDTDQEGLIELSNMLKDRFGYDPGGFESTDDELVSDKIFVRLDWNINKIHKLMVRHSYVNLNAIQPYTSSNQRLYFENAGRQFPSKTNSTALEIKSNWNTTANNLIVGFTSVRDDRDPIGDNFPAVILKDGSGTIYIGSEPYSTANKLDQDIFTVNDNFSIYKGAHTITVGANLEYSHTYNLFIRKNYGEYRYNSVADFMTVGTENEVSASVYDRSYSLVDDVTGDGSEGAATFNTMQLGFYAQDEWQASENFKLTFGLRLDIPMFLTDNKAAPGFNDTVVPKLEAVYDPVSGSNYDLEGARAGEMPKPQFMWAPRIGFNWDVTGDKSTQIRGGVGMFTGRLPLVWPGGAYNNNGVTVGGVYYRYNGENKEIMFRPDYQNQYEWDDFYTGQSPDPSGQIDLFAEDFKYPQVLRASLAIDQKLPWGLVGSLEGIYTKTLNNVIYYNYNTLPADRRMEGGPDDRWLIPSGNIEDRYSRVMVGANTNKGFSYNLTAEIQKNFMNGFQGAVAYTFGRAKSMNDGLSSQNSSQWRYVANVNGRNHLDLSYSTFDLGSRAIAFLGYKKEYAGFLATGISLFYEGISGDRFSYVYNDSETLNGEAYDEYALIWVPKDMSEINLVDYTTSDGTLVTAEEQWAKLDAFISSDKYLEDSRGGYAERNGSRLPFESYLDLRFVQDFYLNAGKTRHTLQFTLDIFNVLNLLNKEWGVHRFVNYDSYELITVEGWENEEETIPMFTYKGGDDRAAVYNVSDPSSRWRMQIGLRYIFGTPKD